MIKAIEDTRIHHINNVANKMALVAKQYVEKHPNTIVDEQRWIQDMYVLGYLHDIGYAFCEEQPEHPYIGGTILRKNNYKYWKEVFLHGFVGVDYSSLELTLLNYCDMTIDSKGNEISMEERVEDIGKRYGYDSSQYLAASQMKKELEEKITELI